MHFPHEKTLGVAHQKNFSANSTLRESKVGYEAARAARW
jgi:hypothetical protein